MPCRGGGDCRGLYYHATVAAVAAAAQGVSRRVVCVSSHAWAVVMWPGVAHRVWLQADAAAAADAAIAAVGAAAAPLVIAAAAAACRAADG